MAPKTFQDAEATYARAAKYELERNWNQAFRLYIQAVETYLHLSRTGTDPNLREKCKASAGKALERAEKIKSAKRELAPVSTAHFSEHQQFYVLKKSSLINGTRYPLWSEPTGQAPHVAALKESSRQFRLLPGEQLTALHWQRPSDSIPGAHIASVSLQPTDIIQNKVSDCSVCASIAVCIEHNYRKNAKLLVSSLFPQNDQGTPVVSKNGIYELKLHINGGYRRIFVDDHLPFDEAGTLIGLSTGRKKQLWPSLIEKAYMTLMGGYDFPGSNSGVDLHVLIGWIPEHIEIKSATFERENTWARTWSAFQDGHCVVSLGTDDKSYEQCSHLMPSHNYAVTDVRETNGERWMSLLDSRIGCDPQPQPQSESETSTDPDSATPKSRLINLSWDDICGMFEGVYLSWNPSIFKHSITFHGIWRQKNTSTEDDSQSSNHYLLLRRHADDKTPPVAGDEIWILLTRHLVNTHRTSEYIALNVQNKDEDGTSRDPGKIATKGTYSNDAHVLVRARAEQASDALGILACYDGPFEDVCFTVTAYSPRAISWDTTLRPPAYTSKVDGILTSKNAGGNCTNPTYMVNPQYHLRIHADKQDAQRAGTQAGVVLVAKGPRDMPLNITVVWSSGERTVELSQKEIVANSGAYTYGHVRIATRLLAGNYTVILSAFDPSQLGAYTLRIESERRFDLKAIPQEGAGMYNRVVKGEWNAANAAGGPSYGRYRSNPVYEIVVPTATTFGTRLQLLKASPPISIGLSLFSSSALDQCVASSGPYSDAISGAAIPLRSSAAGTDHLTLAAGTHYLTLAAGRYYLVPSTYAPDMHAQFRLISYSSVAGVSVAPYTAGNDS
ncbi:hypothetical protein BJ138DRAFT_1160375 [Hygrophoropsis aurantiaca]|uniref:Uncharacterized protein n=1 Tax=Hygrophoropsis aurantiaca TaxID=72124 RepID=A0ACB8A2E0_9AGAM|nr:hypothetical protein BJ138DRAFT_1160375 [Hygrophoropsis aurantiaca]